MRILILLAAATLLAACSPTFNWRELRPEGADIALMLPCKPASHARMVRLAGTEVRLTLHACSAGGVTWALGEADLGDPARIADALGELRRSAAANLGADGDTTMALTVPGATPNPASGRFAIKGKLPDGQPVHEQVAVFTRGTRVYQATCVGATLPAEPVETFFAGLKLGP